MNSRERVALILREVKALPTLPDVATRLLEAGEDPGASMRDIATLVERDVSLATRVLKLINSPFYGLRREVTSVQHALMLLGTAQLRSLVLSGAVVDLFNREGKVGGFDRAAFWKHSVAVAGAARAIAAQGHVIAPDTAFTAGLIHDMGKVVIDRYLHEEFKKVVQLTETDGVTMSGAEQAVLGVTHAEIGHHLAAYWNLPEVLRQAVGFHHQPFAAEFNPPIAAIVATADALVRELGVGNGGGASEGVGESTVILAGIDALRYEELKEHLRGMLEEQVGALTAAD